MQNGPFALTEKSAIMDGKIAWHPPLGHREQRRVKLFRLEFLCVRMYHIRLPSSMADFVPCDQLTQYAHFLELFFSLVAYHVPQTVNIVGKRNFKFARFT